MSIDVTCSLKGCIFILLQEIRRTFECLDKNKDGKLSASEFVRGSKLMHVTMTKEEAKAMIKEVDVNGKYKKFIAVIHFQVTL
jgi:Ca2+-binding EF-hand superfamily protein